MFASDASCGPSNPLQNFGKHAGETSSAQRERFVQNNSRQDFRTTQNQHARQQMNDEFNAFQSQGMPQPAMYHQPPPLLHHQQPPQHFQQQHQPGQTEWASEFAKLSVSSPAPQLHAPPLQQQQAGMGDWRHEFMRNSVVGPNLASPAASSSSSSQFAVPQNISMQPEHRQLHHLHASREAEMRAFEDVFDSVQSELNQQDQPVKRKEVVAEDVTSQKEGEDLSFAAREIVDAVNGSNSMSEHTTKKLQQSQFMNLMQQLSDRKVVLEGEKFVNESGVDVGTVEQAKHERDTTEEHSIAAAAEANNQSTVQPHPQPQPQSQVEVPKDTQKAVLEDPFVYMEKEGVLSPFLAARNLGPEGVATPSGWEENYDEWAESMLQ